MQRSQVIALLPINARIIEIGSGFGRDANYIESFGFRVERTDATNAFVSLLQKQGYVVSHFNILKDNFQTQYDLIFANAVFLHFTPNELEAVLKKISLALNKDGILAFSLKKGEGEEWRNAKLEQPRYFYYWDEDNITDLLQREKFEVQFVFEDEKYIQIIARVKA